MIVRIDHNGKIVKDFDPSIQEALVVTDGFRGYAMHYSPVSQSKTSHIAVVLMHSDQNYMGLKMGPALASRGYHALAVAAWQSGEIDRKMEYLDRMVRYLRELPDIEKIILMGHSGGATLMSAYQSIAENGPGVFQSERMLYKCTVKQKLEPADGIMLIDANYGNGVMTLLSLDPGIRQEGNGRDIDPVFDIFDPENGYDRKGSNYSKTFIQKYQMAQAKRNQELIDKALERLERLEKGEGCYVDDEPFFITAGNQPKPNNRLIPEDIHLLSHTKGRYDLVHGDGSITHENIQCMRTPEIEHSFSNTYDMGVNKNTVKGFLSAQAIRTIGDFYVTEDDILGVDWGSSYASPIGNIEYISVPALFMGMTGSYEYLASEMIYEHAKVKDKTIAFVHGASHVFGPNLEAESIPGEFGDTETALYDYMADWLRRFTE